MTRTFGRAALLLALAVPAAFAQQAASGEHGSHHAQAPKLDAELAGHFKGITLTAEQVKQVTEIKARHHKAMGALKKDAKDPNDAALKASLQKHMDAEHAEFKALLTAEQAKVFEENMKAHHAAEGKHAMKDGMKHDGMKHEAKPPARKPQ
jgi:Spy/CpxP family protein refolding chaperone